MQHLIAMNSLRQHCHWLCIRSSYYILVSLHPGHIEHRESANCAVFTELI